MITPRNAILVQSNRHHNAHFTTHFKPAHRLSPTWYNYLTQPSTGVEKIDGDVGSEVSFDNVLMFSDGDNVKIGQPTLDDVSVRGQIVAQGKDKKVLVFKYKRRKRYRRTQGHRQPFTAIRIDSIDA